MTDMEYPPYPELPHYADYPKGPLVRNAKTLATLPDGSIITWRRIPADRTSEAVAFVHHEIEQGDPRCDDARTVTWISPGGWQPLSIEDAGITYPMRVLREGTYAWPIIPFPSLSDPDADVPMENPDADFVVRDLMHGGTWAREKALESAVLFWAALGGPFGDRNVLDTAEHFETWLERDSIAEDNEPAPEPAPDVALARKVREAVVTELLRAELIVEIGEFGIGKGTKNRIISKMRDVLEYGDPAPDEATLEMDRAQQREMLRLVLIKAHKQDLGTDTPIYLANFLLNHGWHK